MSFASKFRISLILLLPPVLALVLGALLPLELPLGAKGTVDFSQYWSAFELLSRFENPYDPDLLYGVQQQLGQKPDTLIAMWNPPWLLVLLSPLLSLPFERAAGSWFLLNVSFIFMIGILLEHVFANTALEKSSAVHRKALLLGVFFFPFIETLAWGQLSLLLLLSLACFMYFHSQGKFFTAGVFLVPLSTKPHLFLLFGILLLYRAVRNKEFAVILGASASTFFFIAITQLRFPLAIPYWIFSNISSPHHQFLVNVTEWQSATLVGISRSALVFLGQGAAVWPMVVIPVFACVAFASYLISVRPRLEFAESVCCTLALSYVVAPYGWMYDQCILFPLYLLLLNRALLISSKKRRLAFLCSILAIQLICVCQSLLEHGQGKFFWVPFALLAIAWLSREGRPQAAHR